MSSILTLDGWPCIPGGISIEERAEVDGYLETLERMAPRRRRGGPKPHTDRGLRAQILRMLGFAVRPVEASMILNFLGLRRGGRRLFYANLRHLVAAGVVRAKIKAATDRWGRPCRYPIFWTE